MKAALVLVIVFLTVPAGAAPILSVDNSPIQLRLVLDNDGDSFQEIRANHTGRVTRLDLWLFNTDEGPSRGGGSEISFGVTLLAESGNPTVSRRIDFESLPASGLVSFDFTAANLRVSEGEVLRLRHGTNASAIAGANLEEYEGDLDWVCRFSCTHPVNRELVVPPPRSVIELSLNPYDLAFRLFVDVPEPAALLLLASSLAGLGMRRRRRLSWN